MDSDKIIDSMPKDYLAGVTLEALGEEESGEPSSMTNLRSASEREFRYEVLDEIDHGGMKSIHRAIDLSTRRYVALAFIKAEALSDREMRYFIQEAWITARLEHPNIVPIHDIGLDPDGNPYFAMKLLAGENLLSVLTNLRAENKSYQEKFSRRQLLGIFIKICDAISYSHQSGVVHLDLKPENIQVSDFGQVLVMDWGIANLFGTNHQTDEENSVIDLDDFEQTMFGSIKGTPGYIAPEQITGSGCVVDFKADIFGLGGLLYSLLVYKRPPTKISSNGDIIDFDLNDKLDKGMASSKVEIPNALKAVVFQAMKQDPNDRYTNVDELKNDIESYLAGHATRAEDAGFIRMLTLLVQRNLRLCLSIAIGLIILLLVTVTFITRLTISERRAVKNEELALRQKKIVLERDAEARILLKHYEKEKKERERREKTSVQHHITRAKSLFTTFKPNEAWNEIRAAKELNPNHSTVHRMGVHILFSQQRFNLLTKTFKHKPGSHAILIAEKYKKLKADDELLSGENLNNLIDDISWSNIPLYDDAIANTFNTIYAGRTYTEIHELVQKSFDLINPGLSLGYNKHRDRITIVGKARLNAGVLAGLNFKQLNLSHARINDYRVLWSLRNLEYLNIKNTDISAIFPTIAMPNLRYLNLENSMVHSLNRQQIYLFLDYLNIARTTIPWVASEDITVRVLNIAEASKLDPMTIFEIDQTPEIIYITQSQLERFPDFEEECKKNKIDLRVVASAEDVNEDDFL